jgi:adenosine deaminase
LSNHKLCVVKDLADHPLDRMLALGLKATVNSDDPAYFGGYIAENYRAVAEARGLSRDDVVTLARNSFTGSFLPPDAIAWNLEKLDEYVAAQG